METDFSRLRTQALARALSKGEPDTLALARERFPFINQYDPHIKINPRRNAGFAETFPKGEPGAGEFMRPSEFPINSVGVEVYRPREFGPSDYAAEFLHVDPKANQTRADLIKSFTHRQAEILKHELDYERSVQENLTPQHAMNNATDGLMRGYTVGQWPKSAIKDFGLNLNQSLMLDGLKNYMETGNK